MVLQQVNELRASEDLEPLVLDDQLTAHASGLAERAASAHSVKVCSRGSQKRKHKLAQ